MEREERARWILMLWPSIRPRWIRHFIERAIKEEEKIQIKRQKNKNRGRNPHSKSKRKLMLPFNLWQGCPHQEALRSAPNRSRHILLTFPYTDIHRYLFTLTYRLNRMNQTLSNTVPRTQIWAASQLETSVFFYFLSCHAVNRPKSTWLSWSHSTCVAS